MNENLQFGHCSQLIQEPLGPEQKAKPSLRTSRFCAAEASIEANAVENL